MKTPGFFDAVLRWTDLVKPISLNLILTSKFLIEILLLWIGCLTIWLNIQICRYIPVYYNIILWYHIVLYYQVYYIPLYLFIKGIYRYNVPSDLLYRLKQLLFFCFVLILICVKSECIKMALKTSIGNRFLAYHNLSHKKKLI